MSKQISLTKYGFVHNHSKDFTDHGTRFQVYELPGNPYVRATKASLQDEVFVHFRYRRDDFTECYSKLIGLNRDKAAEMLPEVMQYIKETWLPDCRKRYVVYVDQTINELKSSIRYQQYKLERLMEERDQLLEED